MSGLDKTVSADGYGVYFRYHNMPIGQYVKSLNRNGFDAVRTIRNPTKTVHDESMFFLTAAEAEEWVTMPIAIRRLRGT